LENLENNTIREALPVLKDWARDLLYNNAYKGFDITSVMIATALIFSFDRENASCVYRAPCAESHVKNFITTLEGAVPNSIICGINFLRYDLLIHLSDPL
jgi:hypothetical protein